jgi:septal ring factor EnvC (AmiA/AmiB activator)
VLLVALAVLTAMPPARLALAERASSDRAQLDRLAEVRERLERRRALQRDLQIRVDALAAEIEALRTRGERTAAQLQAERQQARVLEQRLDRIVPRFLARVAELNERRAQAAQVLAELASSSRSVRLAPTIRARMLALSPVMLTRLRSMEDGVASLRGPPDRTIERQAEIEDTMAELTSAHQRVQRERGQKRLQRQMAWGRLRELDVEVRLLGAEQARLTRRFARDDAAMMARAEAQTDQRPSPDLVATRGRSPVRGPSRESDSSARTGPVGGVADAWPRAAARVVAAAPGPGTATAASAPADGDGPRASLPSGPYTTALVAPGWPDIAEAAAGRGGSLDVVFAPDAAPSGTVPARAHQGRAGPPILTVPEGPYDRGLIAHGGPDLTIPAAPGQGVAAPVEGRVAFAGKFKSYGLLLILEHEGEYHTLLWGFARLDVRHGDQVQAGQIVGIMGARGDDPPVLHVERRRNGRPLDIAASSNGIQG